MTNMESFLVLLFIHFFPDAPVHLAQSKSKTKPEHMKNIMESSSSFVCSRIPDGTSEWLTLFKVLF